MDMVTRELERLRTVERESAVREADLRRDMATLQNVAAGLSGKVNTLQEQLEQSEVARSALKEEFDELLVRGRGVMPAVFSK